MILAQRTSQNILEPLAINKINHPCAQRENQLAGHLCLCVKLRGMHRPASALKCRSKLPHFKYQKLEFPAMDFGNCSAAYSTPKTAVRWTVLFDTASLTLTRSS